MQLSLTKILRDVRREQSRRTDRRRREQAKQLRRDLVEVLGGRCENPNRNPWCTPTSNLEVDHVHGRLYSAREVGSRDRIRFYWEEFFAGVALRVLCRSCNAGHNPHRNEALAA